MHKVKEEIEKRLTQIDTFITESDISTKSYKNEKAMLINELQDINKPVINGDTLDAIYRIIEDHMGNIRELDPEDCEFDFGIDYDGRISVESIQLSSDNIYDTESLYHGLKDLFKVTENKDESSI
tara:strand:- start:1473 stop:1847 length:375 start_codon:yes stop_codon:yes gene_type:complete